MCEIGKRVELLHCSNEYLNLTGKSSIFNRNLNFRSRGLVWVVDRARFKTTIIPNKSEVFENILVLSLSKILLAVFDLGIFPVTADRFF